MNTTYRVFLYSSDVGRLTHEGDFATEDEAKASVQNWIGDREWDEELAAGMFRIDARLNGHLKGSYRAYAHAYPHERRSERNNGPENETIEQFNERNMARQLDAQKRSKQLISKDGFPTREAAQLAADKAIDDFAMELNPSLYGRIQRQQRAAGINERFVLDLIPFGFSVYQGEAGPKFKLATETTIDDLKAMRFKEGIGIKSNEATFTVESGSLRVTDPCYSMDTWCAGTTSQVKNGTWYAHTQQFHEGMCEWSKERFEKALLEIETNDPSEGTKLGDKLKQMREDMAQPDFAGDRVQMEEAIKSIEGFYKDQALRDFNESYGNPDDWRGRIAYLHIRHESVRHEPIDPFAFFKNEDFQVGVDSGQAGFFDLAKFELVAADKDHKDSPEHEDFYEACGQKTLGIESWGTVQGIGAVSSSGYGDGGYTLCERRNEAGELIEARIVYLLEGSEMFPGIGGEEDEE